MLTSLPVITFLYLFHVATSVSTTDGRVCVFPFIYKGKQYNSCTLDGADSGRLWCAVTPSYDKDGLWGYCGADADPDFGSCPLKADVTFIIEPFTGLTDDDWYTTAEFLKRFIDNFPISSINTRVAIVSTDMPDTFYFNKYFEREPMKNFIDRWLRPQTTERMAALFDLTSSSIFDRDKGDRLDVQNIVVVIVNGQGNTDQDNEARVRAFLLQQNARMYVVGVTEPGEELAKNLLKDESRVITVASVRDLNTVVFPPLISMLCNSGGTPGAATPAPACSTFEVTDMTPNYGPIQGGTSVTIIGCQLAVGTEVPTITLGGQSCSINSLSSSVIVCTTSPRGSAVVELNVQPTASVLYKTGRFFNYHYNAEAIISDIIPTPPKTTVSGNITITLNGRDFPTGGVQMLLTINTASINDLTFMTPCRSLSTNQFTCITPDLSAFAPQAARRRRSLMDMLDNFRGHFVDNTETKQRRKRQIQNARIDAPGYFEVLLGIQMDNNRKYIDLGRLFPFATKLQVYQDPNIFSFGDAQIFRPFPPINQKTIKIKGERLDQGVRAEDYQITVGNSNCRIVKLSFREIECEPPQEPPPETKTVKVFVAVSTTNFSPGEVTYFKNQWEDMSFRAGIGFFIFAFIVVVTIIWVIVACVLQKQIDRSNGGEEVQPQIDIQEEKKKKKKKQNGVLRRPKKKHRDLSPEPPSSSSQGSEPSVSRNHFNTGVSVEGYDRTDWAY